MRLVNLFLTEDGVLKLGYYGLTTQLEYFSSKALKCGGIHSFAPEVLEGEYEIKSDVWSLGITLIDIFGITVSLYRVTDVIPVWRECFELEFDALDSTPAELVDFLKKCFQLKDERWSVSDLMNVSVMGWRMMSSIHL